VWQVGRAAPARLLAGGWEAAVQRTGRRRIPLATGLTALVVGILIVVAGMFGMIAEQAAFLAGGAILLAAGICLLGAMLQPRRAVHNTFGVASIVRLGTRNATRQPARSVLCIGLISLAAFALVTVASMRQGEPTDTADPRSGAGGYQLIVESEIPLLGNPTTRQGRSLLGFREPANPIWDRVEFVPLRRRAGQDVSCLNITQATSPTILGIPDSLIERGGFTTARENPWRLLQEQPITDGAIPIIADDSPAKYILHIGIGDRLDVLDASSAPRQLELVATLPHIVLQSQLLMSEDNLREMFPTQSGFGILLVRVRPEDQDQVRRMLSDELNEYAASVRTTASVLAGYLEVQNTYLSTFELLGALGLALGTIGLAVVLVRTVIERRSELALLAALGFRNRARVWLVLSENAFLLVMGLLLGTVCALIGILPALRDSARGVNISSVVLTLAAVLLVGLGASGIAVLLSSRSLTPADLRKE
jgi:hypothetical protein